MVCLYSNRNLDDNRLNVNGNNWRDNNNGYAFEMALALTETIIWLKLIATFILKFITSLI